MGRIDKARKLVARPLLADPDFERGWLWLATVATDPAEQRYCLNRALEIHPESSGLRRRALLPDGPEQVLPELIELDKPPLPPDLADAGALPRSTRCASRRTILRTGSVASASRCWYRPASNVVIGWSDFSAAQNSWTA
jgi:hypothetical protein